MQSPQLPEEKELKNSAEKLKQFGLGIRFSGQNNKFIEIYPTSQEKKPERDLLIEYLERALGTLAVPKEDINELEKMLDAVNFQALKKINEALVVLAEKNSELKDLFFLENEKALGYFDQGDIENYKLQIFRLLYAISIINEKMVKPNVLYEAGILTSVMGNRPVLATTAIKAVLEAPIEKIKRMSLRVSDTGRAFESLKNAGIETPTKEEAKAKAERGNLLDLYQLLQTKLNEKVPHQRQIICLYFTIALVTANTDLAHEKFKTPKNVIERIHQEAKDFFHACFSQEHPKLGKSPDAPPLKDEYKEFAQTLHGIVSDSSTPSIVAGIYGRLKYPYEFQLRVLALLHNRTDTDFTETRELKLMYEPPSLYNPSLKEMLLNKLYIAKDGERLVCYVRDDKERKEISLDSLDKGMAESIKKAISDHKDLKEEQTRAIFDITSKKGYTPLESTHTFDNYLQGIINLGLWDTERLCAIQALRSQTKQVLAQEKLEMDIAIRRIMYESHFPKDSTPQTAFFDDKKQPAPQPLAPASQQPAAQQQPLAPASQQPAAQQQPSGAPASQQQTRPPSPKGSGQA